MFGLRYLPVVPRTSVRLDGLSALLCMATLAVFISGVDTLGQNLARGEVMIVLATLAGWLLVRRASGQPEPMGPVDLLRTRTVGFAVAALACTFAAQMAASVSLSLLFQQDRQRVV